MPRLSASLLRYALSRSVYLPRLLRECRDLESATNELRWLAYHAYSNKLHHASPVAANARLAQYVRRRARGEPLQYILGNQPFGDLDILCQKGTLIPRPETELYTTTLAGLLSNLRKTGVINPRQPIHIADLCTGTGCIALALHALLRSGDADAQRFPNLHILGADISSSALKLAHRNLKHNVEQGVLDVSCVDDVGFEHLDVLELGVRSKAVNSHGADTSGEHTAFLRKALDTHWDVVISNPPYISPSDYAPGGTVGRSVRNYEPKLALVPPTLNTSGGSSAIHQADQFYEAVLQFARRVRAKVVVLEVGDAKQACRVRRLTAEIMTGTSLLETWRDDGSVDRYTSTCQLRDSSHGPHSAHERAVVLWTGQWMEWRLQSSKCG